MNRLHPENKLQVKPHCKTDRTFLNGHYLPGKKYFKISFYPAYRTGRHARKNNL